MWPALDLLDRRVFLQNLTFIHSVIAATPKLLSVAMQESHGHLAAYFESHLEEERDHAAWLAEDLRSASIEISKVDISPEAAAMAGSQYYLLYHIDPTALLGYMAVLECFPMTEHQIDALEFAHGTKLCRTLRHHATHDIEHGADVLDEIDRLTPPQFNRAAQNALQTSFYIRAASARFSGVVA